MTDFFEFQSRTKILSGKGALLRLAAEIRLLGGSRAILISDATLDMLGMTEHLISVLKEEEIDVPVVYTDVPTDSSLAVADRIAGICRENRIDIIIALGGGSVIDTSKGTRMILSQNSDDILSLSGYEGLPAGHPLPLDVYKRQSSNRFQNFPNSPY